MNIPSITGQTEAEAAADESLKSRVSADLKKKFAQGGGFSVGTAIVIGAFEILHNDSKDAFPLLEKWGPWAMVSIVALYVIYDVLKIALNILLRGTIAIEGMSRAISKVADKDDRQLQELQTLTAFSAQESERSATLIKAIGAAQEETAKAVVKVLEILQQRPQVDLPKLVSDVLQEYKRAEAQGAK